MTQEPTWHDSVDVEEKNRHADGNGKPSQHRRHEHLQETNEGHQLMLRRVRLEFISAGN